MTATSPPSARATAMSWVIVSSAQPSPSATCNRATSSSRQTRSRPLVGSSTISTGAPPARVMANATRCAMPPDSVVGHACAACAMPSPCRSCKARRHACALPSPASACVSASCRPTRMVGSSANHGSCGSSASWRPHIARRVAGSAASQRRPSTVSVPPARRPRGSVPISACASRLLPEPLSPSSVRARPASSVNDTGASSWPSALATLSASTASRGWVSMRVMRRPPPARRSIPAPAPGWRGRAAGSARR
ncbi:hypothetical protein D3C72_927920 [compost metagenome]